MSERTALVIGNGAIGSRDRQLLLSQKFDVIIAADGGLLHAQESGVPVDHLIGDFDSAAPDQLQIPETTKIHHRPSQDINDLEKALQLCLKLGLNNLTLIGFFGRRTDHTLNNLSVLCRYDTLLDLTLFDAYSQVFLVRQRWKNSGQPYRTISLIPLGTVQGVRTKGLAFGLDNQTLEIGGLEGLSNYAIGREVEVTIEKGILAIFVLHEMAE